VVQGVAISSALFQTRLDDELRKRLHTPDAEDVRKLTTIPIDIALADRYHQLILQIRRSSDFIRTLPPAEQRAARDAYAMGLRSVYMLAACATLLAYFARLPVSAIHIFSAASFHSFPDS
jgi:hypothetical protein